MPNKTKKPALLIFSYYFAYNLGGLWTAGALATITVVTFLWGILIEKSQSKKLLLWFFVLILVLILSYDKYFPLFKPLLNEKGLKLSAPALVGISYYTFSAISYMIDIYKGKEQADRNFIDTALWLAFFPKFIAGPIERHSSFKKELNTLSECRFEIERIKRGLLTCAHGYFYKIIIADRISPFVDTVYADVSAHQGGILVLTMILYSLQIYFDFAGYSMIAYGISRALGLQIIMNFNHPYFSENITEFWKRWHISLSSWLKDYIYIPLGGNRCGKIRQYFNIMITFIISGIWHGTGSTFIFWGIAHGLIQIIEREISKFIKLPKIIHQIITFLFVSGAWIFFRADSMQTAKRFIRRMLRWDFREISDGTFLSLSIDLPDGIVLSGALIIAFIIEIIQYNRISIYEKLQNRNIIVRWAVYYLIIVILVIFGVYGAAFDANNFIYFNF